MTSVQSLSLNPLSFDLSKGKEIGMIKIHDKTYMVTVLLYNRNEQVTVSNDYTVSQNNLKEIEKIASA